MDVGPLVEHEDLKRLWYLSFCDTSKPAGSQWSGGCYVLGIDEVGAARQAACLGCNPGGEVAAWLLPASVIVPPEYMNRLLTTREEVGAAVGDVVEDVKSLKEWGEI